MLRLSAAGLRCVQLRALAQQPPCCTATQHLHDVCLLWAAACTMRNLSEAGLLPQAVLAEQLQGRAAVARVQGPLLCSCRSNQLLLLLCCMTASAHPAARLCCLHTVSASASCSWSLAALALAQQERRSLASEASA